MTLTVKEAMVVRAQLEAEREALKEFRFEHGLTTNKKEMRRLTTHCIKPAEAKIAEYTEQLKGAPAEPIEPEKAWELWSNKLVEMSTEYDEMLTKAREALNADKVWASSFVERYADELVAAQLRQNRAKSILIHLTEEPVVSVNLAERMKKAEKLMDEFIKEARKEVFNKAMWGIGRSTSSISNFVEATEVSALAKMVDDLDSWHSYERKMAVDGFNSWLELQNS